MVSVKIEIVTEPVTDIYLRYHGKSVDELMDTGFWTTQPEKIIATTSVGFTDTQPAVELAEGTHYVIYGNSGGGVAWTWYAQIFIDDILVVEGVVHRYDQLRVNFKIKDDLVEVLPAQEVVTTTLVSSGSRHTTPEQGTLGTSLSAKRTRITRHITWAPVVFVRA